MKKYEICTVTSNSVEYQGYRPSSEEKPPKGLEAERAVQDAVVKCIDIITGRLLRTDFEIENISMVPVRYGTPKHDKTCIMVTVVASYESAKPKVK